MDGVDCGHAIDERKVTGEVEAGPQSRRGRELGDQRCVPALEHCVPDRQVCAAPEVAAWERRDLVLGHLMQRDRADDVDAPVADEAHDDAGHRKDGR